MPREEFPPALIHPAIVVGAGTQLTPNFQSMYNITHVINCAFPEDSPVWFQTTYRDNYHCIHAEDGEDVSILKWYAEFKSVLTKFLQTPGRGRVFVHCQCGINRAPFLSLLYVCDAFGYPRDITMRAMRQQRRCVFRNHSFDTQVREYLTKKKE